MYMAIELPYRSPKDNLPTLEEITSSPEFASLPLSDKKYVIQKWQEAAGERYPGASYNMLGDIADAVRPWLGEGDPSGLNESLPTYEELINAPEFRSLSPEDRRYVLEQWEDQMKGRAASKAFFGGLKDMTSVGVAKLATPAVEKSIENYDPAEFGLVEMALRGLLESLPDDQMHGVLGVRGLGELINGQAKEDILNEWIRKNL